MNDQTLPNSPAAKAVEQACAQSASDPYLTFCCDGIDVRVIAADDGTLLVALDDALAARDHIRDRGEGGATLGSALPDPDFEVGQEDGFPRFVSEDEMLDVLDHGTDAAGEAFLSWFDTNVRAHRIWERAIHPETPEAENFIIHQAMQILKRRIEAQR